jgi:hypothetical protein
MMYAYLMVYYMTGAVAWEPVGVAGPSWQGCLDLVNYAAAQRKMQDIQVVKVIPYCAAGPAPK